MLSKEEWNANKDSTSIIYCFEDGTTKEITMAEYLRAHPEHSAEDFRIIKELSDELLYHDYHSDNYHGYWKADQDFSGLAALVPFQNSYLFRCRQLERALQGYDTVEHQRILFGIFCVYTEESVSDKLEAVICFRIF